MTDISRRSFLGGAGLAGAGLLVGALAGCSPSQPSADKGAGTTADAATASAGGYAWEQPLVPITDIVSEESYDIVVVGAGVAGCAAAQSAAEAGASVCLVEKSDIVTGHGQDNAALGSKLQKEKGYTYDKDEAARLEIGRAHV